MEALKDIEVLKENGRHGLQRLATSFGLVRGAALSSLCFLAWGFAAALTPIPVSAQLSATIRADGNLRVEELGAIVTYQSWSLLRFTQVGTTAERWAETRFLEGGGGFYGGW